MVSTKYVQSFIIGMQNALEYRVNFLISLLGIAIPLIMQLFLWTAVFNNASSDQVYGYTFSEMIVYVVLAGLLSKLVATGFEKKIAEDIKNGGISKFLIKPINYFTYTLSCFIGEKSIHLAIMSIIMTIGVISLHVIFGFMITPIEVILFIISVIFALCINFVLFYMLGLIAFYLSEVWGILYGADLAVILVSGGILPLETFGPTLLQLFAYLPFKYIIFFPIQILSGQLTLNEVYFGLGIQIIWIIVLMLIAKFVWTNGLKKYIASGG